MKKKFILLLIGCISSLNIYCQTNDKWTIDLKTNCKVYNENEKSNETIEFTGNCNNENNYADGKGTVTWYLNGNFNRKYEGTFKSGKLEGKILETRANGLKYLGEYKDNKRNGYGSIKYTDGAYYEGEFKDNFPNGQGAIKWINGSSYEGTWLNSRRTGYGTFYQSDGTSYEGEFLNDKREGLGITRFNTKNIIFGEYKDDKVEGLAMFLFPNGEKMYVEMKNNSLNGKFIKVGIDDKVLSSGIYTNNKITSNENVDMTIFNTIKQKFQNFIYNTKNKENIIALKKNIENIFEPFNNSQQEKNEELKRIISDSDELIINLRSQIDEANKTNTNLKKQINNQNNTKNNKKTKCERLGLLPDSIDYKTCMQ